MIRPTIPLRTRLALVILTSANLLGCATIKQSDTSRTGIEQLLISSADDKALDKFDLRPIAGAKVFVDTQYLDCTDKNYLLIALHQRLLANHCTLVAKQDDSDVVLEIGSGGVGTDRNDLFFGFPGMALPPPAMVALPRIALFERDKSMGTAKVALVAYDTKTRQPVINSGYSLARADHNFWQVLGMGGQQSGSVQRELVASTNETPSAAETAAMLAQKPGTPVR
ncbi:MAG TPA: DUF6655 family protein [Pirellulales bacterium]|nr:DUF6655 family protein [Pirellulales bacterium]